MYLVNLIIFRGDFEDEFLFIFFMKLWYCRDQTKKFHVLILCCVPITVVPCRVIGLHVQIRLNNDKMQLESTL